MTPTIRVVMLIQGYLPRIGGAERQLAALAPLLNQRGVEIHVLTRKYAGLSAYEEMDGVPVHRLPIPGPKAMASLAYTASALPLIRRLQPDVLHAHELLSPTTTAVLAKRLMGMPVVTKILRGGTLGDLAKLHNKPGGLRRLASFKKQVDGFIAISDEIVGELTAVGVPPERQLFIPNGVDTQRFNPAQPSEKVALRQKLRLPEGLNVVFTGRLSPEKRVNDVITAWPAIRRHVPNANLLLIGSGDEEATLKEMAGDGVYFLGRIEDVAPYLRSADLFILPSETEGLSNALLEAMACGLPAVVTAVGGATDLIVHQKSGWLIPPKSEEAIHDAVATLLANEEMRNRLGTMARQKIMSEYTLNQTADRLVQLYRALISQQKASFSKPQLEVES